MILTTSYFPNLQYFDKIIQADQIKIEACENYQKQSLRNRFEIVSDKGIQILTLPVHSRNNIPVKEVLVDYTMSWQKLHLKAIKTYYGAAPYFPYVMDKIEDLFYIKEKWLLDYNMTILNQLLKILHINKQTSYTEVYTPIQDNDSRLITSKNYKGKFGYKKEYYQVFSDKQPFIPNLSIIDYMMCEGFSLD